MSSFAAGGEATLVIGPCWVGHRAAFLYRSPDIVELDLLGRPLSSRVADGFDDQRACRLF
jgi:hypothetical protein